MSEREKWQDIAGIMTQGEYTQRKRVLDLERQVADLTRRLEEAQAAIEKTVKAWRAQVGPQESMRFRAVMRELEARHALAQRKEGRDETRRDVG